MLRLMSFSTYCFEIIFQSSYCLYRLENYFVAIVEESLFAKFLSPRS